MFGVIKNSRVPPRLPVILTFGHGSLEGGSVLREKVLGTIEHDREVNTPWTYEGTLSFCKETIQIVFYFVKHRF